MKADEMFDEKRMMGDGGRIGDLGFMIYDLRLENGEPTVGRRWPGPHDPGKSQIINHTS